MSGFGRKAGPMPRVAKGATKRAAKGAALAGLMMLGLAGCVGDLASGGGLPLLGGAGAKGAVSRAETAIPVAGGAVTVAGPRGYCIDRKASRLRGDAAFVLLASCATVTGDPAAGRPARAGLLTAAVDRPGDAAVNLKALSSLMTLPEGRAVLARDGRAESVTILGQQRENGTLIMQIVDNSENPLPGLEPGYWRGFTVVNGRLVTTTVFSFARRPLAPAEAAATLRAFLARIKAETRDAGAQQDAGQPPISPLRGLFRLGQT